MKKYSITYTETFVHTFDVYAENPEQAEELAHKMIAAEEIDLSKGFCSDSEMMVYNYADNSEFFAIWIKMLLDRYDIHRVDELTKEQIETEISEVRGTIENERIWNDENADRLEEYIEYLEDLIEDMEV